MNKYAIVFLVVGINIIIVPILLNLIGELTPDAANQQVVNIAIYAGLAIIFFQCIAFIIGYLRRSENHNSQLFSFQDENRDRYSKTDLRHRTY